MWPFKKKYYLLGYFYGKTKVEKIGLSSTPMARVYVSEDYMRFKIFLGGYSDLTINGKISFDCENISDGQLLKRLKKHIPNSFWKNKIDE